MRPINTELMGKTSGKLIVYLEPSIEKNQEECESKRFVTLDQFRKSLVGARCSDSENIEYRQPRDKGMAGVHGFVIRYYALRLLGSGILLTGANLRSRSALSPTVENETRGLRRCCATRKAEEEHMRSKEEDRGKERDRDRAQMQSLPFASGSLVV